MPARLTSGWLAAGGHRGPPPSSRSPSKRRPVRARPGGRQAAPGMPHTPTPTPQPGQSIRIPFLWGLAFGAIQAASPLALRWLDQATVQSLLLAAIAAVYVGFAVA